MKLYAVTLYRPGEDPTTARVHTHYKSKELAKFYAAGKSGANGWLACATAVDVGDAGEALLELINDPNWINTLDRFVVWTPKG